MEGECLCYGGGPLMEGARSCSVVSLIEGEWYIYGGGTF